MMSQPRAAWLGLLMLSWLAAPAQVGLAAGPVWRNTGPGGGRVLAVAVAPIPPATLYAVSGLGLRPGLSQHRPRR
jgi:hypothetical protein